MRVLSPIKAFVLLILGLMCFDSAYSQLTVDVNMPANQMVQNLVGTGVQISNVQVTAADSSYAYYYSSATELGTSQGLLLSTGLATSAIGPNNSTGLPILCGLNCCVNCELFDNHFAGSALLNLAQDRTTFDACMIEFDIVPQGDSLKFKYSFASEEYLEWVGSPFNDVFGFFITGPNVGVDVNIALIPGTSQPVAINTVNHIQNTQYFYNNQNPFGQFVQFDGFTKDLEAKVGNLIPCETYHLKLIIADATDRLYDSGVFIQAIESNPVIVLTATAGGIDNMVEGCNAGTITFSTAQPVNNDYDITYWIGGTATNGVDYTPTLGSGTPGQPITITIPAGQSSVSVDIEPVADEITEGTECMIIYLANPLCSNLAAMDSVVFCIQDLLDVQISAPDESICLGDCITLTGNAITQGSATFEWSPTEGMSNAQSLSPTVCPTETTTYTLTSTVAGCEDQAQITIAVSAITLLLEGEDVQCADTPTGCISLSISGAQGQVSIQWSGPDEFVSTQEDLCGLAAGTYCVTVSDEAGCSTTQCITLQQVNVLALSEVAFSNYTCYPISCPGACDGAIDITVVGGVGPYTFGWSNDETTEDVNGLCAGIYQVTVTDAVGCSILYEFNVEEPQPVTLQLEGVVNVLCNGSQTGSICVDVSGGCAPYYFSWSHDESLNTPCAFELSSGTYTVQVADVNNCQSEQELEIVVGEPQAPLSVTTDEVSLYNGGYSTSCPGSTDGYIHITIDGGTPDYSVQWFDQFGNFISSSDDLDDVPCGLYSVLVIDDNGCSLTQNFSLSCVPQIQIEYTVTPNPCGNGNAGIGAIDITAVSGGNGGPYTFSWSGPDCGPCTTEDLSGLNSGNYTLTVTDAFDCAATFDVNVGTSDSFNVTSAITDASCFGVCNGGINLTVTPAASYTFEWSGPNGFSASTEDVSGLCAGIYSVNISSAGCSGTFNFGIGQPAPILIVVESTTSPACVGLNTGAIDISVLGGNGALSYTWTGDAGCSFAGASTQDISGVPACCYTVLVEDAGGCAATQTICLNAPQAINVFLSTSSFPGGYQVSCAGGNNGQISLTVTGGAPDCAQFAPNCYGIDWSLCSSVAPNPNNATSLNNLGAGTYCVTVSDANGCQSVASVTLNAPPAIISNAVISSPGCNGGCTGSITPNISGGSGTYTLFNWTAGASIGANQPNATTLTNLCPGLYVLTVTDSYGCSQTFNYTISNYNPIAISVTNVQQISCTGSCDGAFSYSVSGGQPLYTISVTDDNGNLYSGFNLSGLCAGNYTITVTDMAGCIATTTVGITGNQALTATLSVPTQYPDQQFTLQCFGDCNGTIIASASGGSGNYTYLWTNDLNQVIGNSAQINELCAGTYCVEIDDQNGCVIVQCATITQPSALLQVTSAVSNYPGGFQISCYQACDGAIDLTITGGVPAYQFNWNSSVGTPPPVEDLSSLCAGVYEVLVTDANYCSQLVQFALGEPNEITINPDVSNYNSYGVSCNGDCNGWINITPNGGFGELNVLWTSLGTSATSLTDLCAGAYEVCITDELGCQRCQTLAMVEPQPLGASIAADIGCSQPGILCATNTGGVAPYSIAWSSGEMALCIPVVNDGTYCYDVTDANGCTASTCLDVDIPAALNGQLNITSTTCGNCNAVVEISVVGGISPYLYDWTGSGTNDGQPIQSNLCPGTYSVVVTDQNGCTISASGNVPQENAIQVNPTSSGVLCNGAENGFINVSILNAALPITYQWTDAQGNNLGSGTGISNLSPGTYTLVWTDDEGCTGTEDYTITEGSPLVIDATVSQYSGSYNISSIGGNDGWIAVQVSGGVPAYNYQWTPPSGNDTTTVYQNLPAGTYTLLVTDAAGCTALANFNLVAPADLEFPTGLSPNGDNLNDSYVIHGAANYPDNVFKVFNRWGNLVYEKKGYTDQWHGQNSGGEDLADGTYYVVFEAGEKSFATYVDLRR